MSTKDLVRDFKVVVMSPGEFIGWLVKNGWDGDRENVGDFCYYKKAERILAVVRHNYHNQVTMINSTI